MVDENHLVVSCVENANIQVRSTKIRPAEVNPFKIAPCQITSTKVSVTKVGTMEIQASQGHMLEIRPMEVSFSHS